VDEICGTTAKGALVERLAPGAAIGMDGVFAMQPFYGRGGFVLAERNIRFEGGGEAAATPAGLVDAREVPFADLAAYDAAHFAAPRPVFVDRWISQPDSRALVVMQGSEIQGFGVAQACRRGYKVGPLFAADPGVAEDLFVGLSHVARDRPIFLDVPGATLRPSPWPAATV
jgi:Acetyltransferase (GNAT) domain